MEKKHLHSFKPVGENAQTYLKLKGLELRAGKKTREGKRELICSNTHGSVTEKLHSVTKQVNINEKILYIIMMFAIISSVLLFTMTTMPLFWFYF